MLLILELEIQFQYSKCPDSNRSPLILNSPALEERIAHGIQTVHHMQCAVYKLQLKDGLQHLKTFRLLTKVRAVVGKLRLPSAIALVKKKSQIILVFDCAIL